MRSIIFMRTKGMVYSNICTECYSLLSPSSTCCPTVIPRLNARKYGTVPHCFTNVCEYIHALSMELGACSDIKEPSTVSWVIQNGIRWGLRALYISLICHQASPSLENAGHISECPIHPLLWAPTTVIWLSCGIIQEINTLGPRNGGRFYHSYYPLDVCWCLFQELRGKSENHQLP